MSAAERRPRHGGAAARRVARRRALASRRRRARACACGASDHGLPFVYNADENAHFVPRRDRDVRAHLQPELLHQPAGLHVPAARRASRSRFGGRDGGRARPSRPTPPTSSPSRARCRRLLGALAVGLLAWAGARLFDRRVGLVAAALLAVAFLPVYYGALRAQRRPDARAASASRWSASPASCARGRLGDYALAGRRARARLRDQVHRRASCCCRCWRRRSGAARAASDARRVGGLVLAGVLALGVLPHRQPVRAARLRRLPRRARASSRRRRATAAASSA